MITMDFVLAGKAVFTVNNDKKEHFTFKVTKHKTNDMFFAHVLSGADGMYTYMGVFNKTTGKVSKGQKGISSDAKSVKVLEWAIRVIRGETTMPSSYDIQHSGMCGRCSKTLTDPESIRLGIGPTCRGRL